jgi:hypothetical protein
VGEPDEKFEEDIAAPFVSRFSHSNSLEFAEDSRFGDNPPATLGEAALLFPSLSQLRHDGLPCPAETKLEPVNTFKVHERVHPCPKKLIFAQDADHGAEVALILWTRGKNGRPLAAEFSFRYLNKSEQYPAAVARAARGFFMAWQQSAWVQPQSLTKTQFVYRR